MRFSPRCGGSTVVIAAESWTRGIIENRCDYFVEHSIGFKVSAENQRGIARVIVLSIVSLLFRIGRALNILKPADNRIAVGMHLVCGRIQLLHQESPWGVEAHPQFFNHNFLFRFKLLRREDTIHHAIGFDVQSDFPAVRSEIEVVGGKVVGSERVVVPAVLEGEKVDRAFLEAVGAFEEHVLQKMRLPGLSEFLVPGADPIPDHRCDNGRRMKFSCENS